MWLLVHVRSQDINETVSRDELPNTLPFLDESCLVEVSARAQVLESVALQ